MEQISRKQLSALVLTFNEEDNIERVLEELKWIPHVVVLDSYSTDRTLDIVKQYPNTIIHFRKFDTHGNQWNHGLSLVESEWVLTLDADYILTPEFVAETRKFIRDNNRVAFNTKFRFAVFGKPLTKNNTTPRPVLFKKSCCSYFDDGHTQRLRIEGNTGSYASFIVHDDRKPLSRWVNNLNEYSIKECRKIMNTPNDESPWVIRIRKTKIFAPLFVFFYCLIVNRAILDGWRGWHYTLQRTLVEILFSLRLIEEENLKQIPRQDALKQDSRFPAPQLD